MKATLTTAEYLRSEIQNKLNENVATEVQLRLAERMALGNTSAGKFDEAARMLKQKIRANKEVIEIYTQWLEQEEEKEAGKVE